jgi:hypothetical protein
MEIIHIFYFFYKKRCVTKNTPRSLISVEMLYYGTIKLSATGSTLFFLTEPFQSLIIDIDFILLIIIRLDYKESLSRPIRQTFLDPLVQDFNNRDYLIINGKSSRAFVASIT